MQRKKKKAQWRRGGAPDSNRFRVGGEELFGTGKWHVFAKKTRKDKTIGKRGRETIASGGSYCLSCGMGYLSKSTWERRSRGEKKKKGSKGLKLKTATHLRQWGTA